MSIGINRIWRRRLVESGAYLAAALLHVPLIVAAQGLARQHFDPVGEPRIRFIDGGGPRRVVADTLASATAATTTPREATALSSVAAAAPPAIGVQGTVAMPARRAAPEVDRLVAADAAERPQPVSQEAAASRPDEAQPLAAAAEAPRAADDAAVARDRPPRVAEARAVEAGDTSGQAIPPAATSEAKQAASGGDGAAIAVASSASVVAATPGPSASLLRGSSAPSEVAPVGPAALAPVRSADERPAARPVEAAPVVPAAAVAISDRSGPVRLADAGHAEGSRPLAPVMTQPAAPGPAAPSAAVPVAARPVTAAAAAASPGPSAPSQEEPLGSADEPATPLAVPRVARPVAAQPVHIAGIGAAEAPERRPATVQPANAGAVAHPAVQPAIPAYQPADAPAATTPTPTRLAAAPAMPGPPADPGETRQFLRTYEPGGCFLATAFETDRQVGVVGFTTSEAEWRAFNAALAEAIRGNVTTVSSQVSEAQCAALAFARRQANHADAAVAIKLESDRIRNGTELAGTIDGTAGRSTLLLLVDDEGTVEDVSRLLRQGNDGRFGFRTPLSLTSGEVATAQLMIALVSDQSLGPLTPGDRMPAATYFESLATRLKAHGLALDIAVTGFAVEP